MKLDCTNCGAEVPIEERSDYVSCAYCNTALYVETDQTVPHYVLPPEISEREVEPLLVRKLAAVEVDDPLTVERVQTIFYPFWRFEREGLKPVMLPAVGLPVAEAGQLEVPFGGARHFGEDIAEQHELVAPDALLAEELAQAVASSDEVGLEEARASLVHVPLLRVGYRCQNREFQAFVEGVSGRVLGDEWPAAPGREKTRLMASVAAGTSLVFLAESLLIESWLFTLGAFGLTAGAVYLVAQHSFREHGW